MAISPVVPLTSIISPSSINSNKSTSGPKSVTIGTFRTTDATAQRESILEKIHPAGLCPFTIAELKWHDHPLEPLLHGKINIFPSIFYPSCECPFSIITPVASSIPAQP